MSINERLNQLYGDWEKEHQGEHLVRHGIVDEETYRKAEPRIVLLGKEVNAMKEPQFNLLEYLIYTLEKSREGEGFKKSETQAGLWAYGILKECPDYPKSKLVLNRYTAEGIRSIGWTNLSKICGGGKANHRWKEHAVKQWDLTKEELKIMDPQLILCSGEDTYGLVTEILGLERKRLLDKTEKRRKINYSIWPLENHKFLCLDFYHHAARGGYGKYYGILEEVYNKCKFEELFTWK